jgi:hypothetical protein
MIATVLFTDLKGYTASIMTMQSGSFNPYPIGAPKAYSIWSDEERRLDGRLLA